MINLNATYQGRTMDKCPTGPLTVRHIWIDDCAADGFLTAEITFTDREGAQHTHEIEVSAGADRQRNIARIVEKLERLFEP